MSAPRLVWGSAFWGALMAWTHFLVARDRQDATNRKAVRLRITPARGGELAPLPCIVEGPAWAQPALNRQRKSPSSPVFPSGRFRPVESSVPLGGPHPSFLSVVFAWLIRPACAAEFAFRFRRS